MAKKIEGKFYKRSKKKRPNVHSKNASKGQKGYKKKIQRTG